MAIRFKIYQSEYPYHIYNRVNNKEHIFNLQNDFPIFMNALRYISQKTEFIPHHFILMKNHFHLIGSTPKANLYQFMHQFQTDISRKLNQNKGRINHIFGSRYAATVISDEVYLVNVIRYLYQNVTDLKNGTLLDYNFSTLKIYFSDNWKAYGLDWDPYLKGLSADKRLSALKEISELFLPINEKEAMRKRLRNKSI